MSTTKSLIVCHSLLHGNTRRVADEMGRALMADVVTPNEVDMGDLLAFELVGFGAGVRNNKLYPRLLELVEAMPQQPAGKAFVFATSGFPDGGLQKYTKPLVRLLEEKGFEVVGTFTCRGWDTWAPFKPVGGIRKGRPDRDDLRAARTFAENLLADLAAPRG
ncbi:flavodoxin family protein [Streptomyces sp. NPDC058289]|uniref:flavodoxin family protein n=1 Tax=Streptomyces sp. NPDC058289 TaxID=3346425 RepID=UPI0036EA67C0